MYNELYKLYRGLSHFNIVLSESPIIGPQNDLVESPTTESLSTWFTIDQMVIIINKHANDTQL